MMPRVMLSEEQFFALWSELLKLVLEAYYYSLEMQDKLRGDWASGIVLMNFLDSYYDSVIDKF